MGSKDDPVSSQKMTQCGVNNQESLVEPKDLNYLQKVSFKGSHLVNPKPTLLLTSPISGMRFILRVVVCNILKFYQILGEFFCFGFICVV
jgi:hypothetical protein